MKKPPTTAAIAQGHRVSLAGGFGVKLCGPTLQIAEIERVLANNPHAQVVTEFRACCDRAADPCYSPVGTRSRHAGRLFARLLEPHIGKAMSCELAAINGV